VKLCTGRKLKAKNKYERISIAYRVAKNGINVRINKRNYNIRYPPSVWRTLSIQSKHFLSDNLVSLVGMQLPFFLGSKKIRYASSFPLLEPFFREVNILSAPFCSDADGKPVADTLKQFINAQHKFKNYKIKKPQLDFEPEEKSVVTFTFGKDSLLSYAVCKEIGLEPLPVYIREPDLKGMYENKHKKMLQKKFIKEFRKRVLNLDYGLGHIHYSESWKDVQPTNFGSTTQLTEYALCLVPFMKKYCASYLVFGNEKSCSDSHYTDDGFESNPVYDQSASWMLRIKAILSIMTRNMCTGMSVVEPLHEIAIIKVLYNRYKKLAKYQTSCFADNENGVDSRWCCNCSKCARMFIFLLANGINPKKVDINRNMLDKKSKPLYPLFNANKGIPDNKIVVYYDLSEFGRDEQLLAFYLAYKKGAKGYLIDEFKKKFLKEAKRKEDELYKKFFKVHNSITMPYNIKKQVISIYKEELGR